MSYGNVRTPKIMTNLFEWITTHKGYAANNTYAGSSVYYNATNAYFNPPVNKTSIYSGSLGTENIDSGLLPFWDNCFSNTNFGTTNLQFNLDFGFDISGGYDIMSMVNSVLIVAEDLTGHFINVYAHNGVQQLLLTESISNESYNINTITNMVENKGHVLMRFNETDNLLNYNHLRIQITNAGQNVSQFIKAIIVGNMYEFEHSPQLSVSTNIQFDGVESSTGIYGHDASTSKYIGKPNNPFAIHNPSVGYVRNVDNLIGSEGRKSWDLNFNFLSDSKTLPNRFNDISYINPSSNFAGDFYSSVLSKTIGNHLKFLFIPNSQDDSPQDMFICKFDQSEFPFEEVAPGLYNMNLKIKESW